MKTIRIYYVDFWKEMDPETFYFTKLLRTCYHVILTKDNPDFVFCSHFGTDYLQYQCPRILYLGEAKCPDFNLYDYAIAFDYMSYGDRYIRYPFYLIRRDSFDAAIKKHTYSDEIYLSKSKFCNYVVSNGSGADPIRDYYFDEISQYKHVDSAGGYRNNMPGGKRAQDKYLFQQEYRYSLAFENSSFKGYTTEKLIDAWAAATIPIYWGDPEVGKEFNVKAFLNISDYPSSREVINRIQEIERDRDLYLSIMKQPILLPGSPVTEMMLDAYLLQFFQSIFDQDPLDAYRRNSRLTMWGKAYEHHIKRWDEAERSFIGNTIRMTLRKLRK